MEPGVMDFSTIRALGCYVSYIVLVIILSEVAIAVGEMKTMSFMECNSNEYNVYNQNGYTLEWSGNVESSRTFTCKFRGYKQSDDDSNFLVCIIATTWDVDYDNPKTNNDYGLHQPDDISMEYYTYSQTESNRFGDGWFISSTKKTFNQRPYTDSPDPTEVWCEGKKDESDEIVGVQLTVRPGSPERRVVLNITGKPTHKDIILILGLSIGLSMLATAIICAVVITVVYRRNKKREIERNYAGGYSSYGMRAYGHQNRGSRSSRITERQETPNISNGTRGSSSNLFTPSDPLADPIIDMSDVDAPPPVYDDVVSYENRLRHIKETDSNRTVRDRPSPPSYQSVTEGHGDLSFETFV